MSHTSQNLGMTVLENGDPADLMTVSDNFDAIDAVVGDIATVESSPTASSHAVGEFLLYEGRLYKVTAAISAGDSLVLGTNVQAANVGNEIKSLKDSLVYTKTINNWRLTQYPDGTVTAFTWWGIDTIGAFTQWGNLYNVKVLDPVTYPITFSEVPTVRLELYGLSAAVSSLYLYGEGTRTVSPQVWAMRPDAAPAGHHLGLSMYVTGRAPSIR